MTKTLEKKLSKAGYRLLGETKEIEDLIQDILRSKNTRFLKAIPFLLYLYELDLKKLKTKIKDKKLFDEIITITKKIFKQEGIQQELPKSKTKTKLDFSEFMQEFILQKKRSEKQDFLLDKERIYAERNLQMSLSQIFTKKEKEIINNILNKKKLTKTEYEYYSRKTKKKLKAIINLKEFSMAILPAEVRKE